MTGFHISLFAGVGMTDLAMGSLGWTTVATAESDPWCRGILRKRFAACHFPDVNNVRIGDDEWSRGVPRPLLVSGGFPCQGTSASGAGRGLSDPRSGLWGEFARVIHEFRPDLVFIENSPMLKTRGLDRVLCDLSDERYDARWDCFPAASVGAPHLRDRLFLVAWPRKSEEIDYSDLERPYLGAACTAGIYRTAWLNNEGGDKFVKRLPRAGELRCGFVSERKALAPLRGYRGLHLYPTPRRAPNDWRTTQNAPSHGKTHGKTLAGEVNDQERSMGRTPAKSSNSAGNMNPVWVEWLMGLPLGWTDPDVDNGDLICHPGWLHAPCDMPRTIFPQAHRRARLMALGNGLVPQAAARALASLNES